MRADPIHSVLLYLRAGRLAEALQLLRTELARDPNNGQFKELAADLAPRIQAQKPPVDVVAEAEQPLAIRSPRRRCLPRPVHADQGTARKAIVAMAENFRRSKDYHAMFFQPMTPPGTDP